MYEYKTAQPAPKRRGLLRKGAIVGVAAMLVGGMFLIGNGVASADDKPEDTVSVDFGALPNEDPTEKPKEKREDNKKDDDKKDNKGDKKLDSKADGPEVILLDERETGIYVRPGNPTAFNFFIEVYSGDQSDGSPDEGSHIQQCTTGQEGPQFTKPCVFPNLGDPAGFTVHVGAFLGKEIFFNSGAGPNSGVCFEVSGTSLNFNFKPIDCDPAEVKFVPAD